MAKVYLSLGSNIKPRAHIQFAIRKLEDEFLGIRFSTIYESKAVGFEGGNFLNLVACFDTNRTLEELIVLTEQLEQQAGRIRVARGAFDSRTLDIDILMFGDLQGKMKGIQLPSPDIAEYAHVLLPLSELAETSIHPQLNVTFGDLCEQFFANAGDIRETLLWEASV